MRQILFTIPGLGVPIFGYGVMLFVAFLASMNIAAWKAKQEKLDPETVYDMAFWVFIGGLVGARAFYVAQYWGTNIKTFWDLFKIWEGGIVLYGSIIGGALSFFFYRWLRPFPIRPMMDAIAPAIAIGVAIGRIGCFLNGCCWGDACSLPWAVQFPRNSGPWRSEVARGLIAPSAEHSLSLHPTQLYSTLDGLILLALLLAYYPLRKRDGEVIALLMVTYPVTRFLVEHLRNDEGIFFLGMTVSQTISVGLFTFGVLYWIRLSRLPKERYADRPVELAHA